MRMESSKHFLEPYEVFIQKKFLLDKNKCKQKEYYLDDLWFLNDKIFECLVIKYIISLSEKGYFLLKEMALIENPNPDKFYKYGFPRYEELSTKLYNQGKTILDKIVSSKKRVNLTKQQVIILCNSNTMLPFVEREELEESETSDGKKEKIFYPESFYFKIEFKEEGMRELEKELNTYIDLFIADNLGGEWEECYSCSNSITFLERIIEKKVRLQGVKCLRITKDDLFTFKPHFDGQMGSMSTARPYRFENDYISSEEEYWFDSFPIRVLEALLAMEKQGQIEITELFSDFFIILPNPERLKKPVLVTPQPEVLKPVEEEQRKTLVQPKIPKLIVDYDKGQNSWRLRYGEKEYIPGPGHKIIFEKLWKLRRVIMNGKIDKKYKGEKSLSNKELREDTGYKDSYALNDAIKALRKHLEKEGFPTYLKGKRSREEFRKFKDNLTKEGKALIDIANTPREGYMLIIENIIVEEKIIK